MFQNLERESYYLGNLAGVPILVHWSAILLLLLVWGGSNQGGIQGFLLVLIVLIAGIVLHELGHGLMARALGAHGITITLWAMGGLCKSQRDRSTIPRELAIVAAGPAVSLVLWQGGFLAIHLLAEHAPQTLAGSDGTSLLFQTLALTAVVNRQLFIFNMLPIFPMDGGQLVFFSALGITRNQLLARQISLFLSIFGAIAFFLWRTGLFAVLEQGGGVGAWMGALEMWDIVLAVFLFLIVRSAWAYLR